MNRKPFFTALILAIALCPVLLCGQQTVELPARAYELYPTLLDMHGFAAGHYQQQWLIFGGRIRSDVPELYAEDFPNTELIVIDLDRNRATAYTSGNFEGVVGEQLAATGLSFHQENEQFFILGGYGYSETYDQFMTFPYLTVVDLPATLQALRSGRDPVANIYQICDENLAIFDAVLDYNGQTFFLINGRFAYKLRPFGEDPQYYEESRREEVRTFGLESSEGWQLTDFRIWYDLPAMRDYYGPLLPPLAAEELNRMLRPVN